MRLIAILVLLFGAGLSAAAMYLASQHMQRAGISNSENAIATVNVIVAKTVLPYGTAIVPKEHLKWVAWPETSMPEGVFTTAEDLLGPQQDDGSWPEVRYVLRQIEAGEPILEQKITGFGESQRMAMHIAKGRRAFTIRIDAVSGVAGHVAPGDRVDVLMTRKERGSLESIAILENIRVIAVDQKTNDQSNGPSIGRTATVDVTGEEAQKLALAQQLGRLSLSLRGYQDPEALAETPRPADRPRAVNVRDLLGEEIKPERTGTSVIIRKGGEIADSVTFE